MVEIKPTSFRLPEETLKQIDELQGAFSPLTKNRADCLTLLVAAAHSLVVMRGRIAGAFERLQGLLGSDFVAQRELDFSAVASVTPKKPPVRVSRVDGRHPHSISQSGCRAVLVGEEEMAAWSVPSFLGGFRLSFDKYSTARLA